MKINNFPNSFIEYLLILLFAFIVIITAIISINTNATNNNLDKINSQAKKASSILINNKYFESTVTLDSIITTRKNLYFIINVDSVLYEKQKASIRESTDNIVKLNRYILDSNTISYLFQMISLLLLGLGVYLLMKGSEFIKRTDELSKELKNLIDQSKFSNELIRACEIMNFYSQFLVQDNSPYNQQNLFYCSKIMMNNDKINKSIKKNHTKSIDNSDSSTIKDLLNYLLRKLENLRLNEIEGYYCHIYAEIEKSIELVQSLKTQEDTQKE